MNPADILTCIRLVLIPSFVGAFLQEHFSTALILFSIAGFTDLIDGTVARLSKTPSRFGAILDPIADKLLLGTCFVLLTFSYILPKWFLVLALGRDIMILSGIAYLKVKHSPFIWQALVTSKVATLFQLLVAVVGLSKLYSPDFLAPHFYTWFHAILLITALLLIISGAQYLYLGFDILRSKKGSHAGEQ